MRARTLYIAGTVFWLLTGIAHLIGQFATGPGDLTMRTVTSLMHGTTVDKASGLNLYEVLECWGLYYGLMNLLMAVLNVAVLRSIGRDAGSLRTMAAANAFAGFVLLVASAVYRFPPPIVCNALITISFALARWTSPGDTSSTGAPA
jgi:hypothetical protein